MRPSGANSISWFLKILAIISTTLFYMNFIDQNIIENFREIPQINQPR